MPKVLEILLEEIFEFDPGYRHNFVIMLFMLEQLLGDQSMQE